MKETDTKKDALPNFKEMAPPEVTPEFVPTSPFSIEELPAFDPKAVRAWLKGASEYLESGPPSERIDNAAHERLLNALGKERADLKKKLLIESNFAARLAECIKLASKEKGDLKKKLLIESNFAARLAEDMKLANEAHERLVGALRLELDKEINLRKEFGVELAEKNAACMELARKLKKERENQRPVKEAIPVVSQAHNLQPLWYDLAISHLDIDTKEVEGPHWNPFIKEVFEVTGFSRYQDEKLPWCAVYIAYLLIKSGLSRAFLKEQIGWFESSRAWMAWAAAISEGDQISCNPGDIIIFGRTEKGRLHPHQGHISVFHESSPGIVRCVGGNQDNRVNITAYSTVNKAPLRVIGVIRREKIEQKIIEYTDSQTLRIFPEGLA